MADAMSGEPDGGGDGDGPNQPLPSAAERADGGDCRGAARRAASNVAISSEERPAGQPAGAPPPPP